jgi:hypothetical protein
LGKRLVDGPQLRSAPPIEGVWSGTFNLRWWQHVEREHETTPESAALVIIGKQDDPPAIPLHLVVR